MNGWIKLYRKIMENPIVTKDADYLAIWVYLLLNATHDTYPALFRGKKILLKPGQLLTGRKAIASRLSISESKVGRVLETFKNEHQIEQQTSNKNRLISIVNWDFYQGVEQQNEQQLDNNWTANEQQVNNNRTTSEQQLNTNKNVKNNKNNKNDKNVKECKNERSNHNTHSSLSLPDLQELVMWENLDGVIAVSNDGFINCVISNGKKTNEYLALEYQDVKYNVHKDKTPTEQELIMVELAVKDYAEGGIITYGEATKHN